MIFSVTPLSVHSKFDCLVHKAAERTQRNATLHKGTSSIHMIMQDVMFPINLLKIEGREGKVSCRLIVYLYESFFL